MGSVTRIGFTLLAGIWLVCLEASAARAEDGVSAQSLLFDAPYLTRLDLPATLAYGYRHVAANEKLFGNAFEDTVRVKVAASDKLDGLNTVSLEIFSGARQRLLGPHADMRGNPVIMIFLERDVWEMKRRVGGVPVYYRNKIRKALRDAAKIEPIEIRWNGVPTPAHKVTIKPFHDDPNSARLKEFRAKSYEFVVAATVPGGFYQIRSWVPKPDGKDALIEDKMTFTGTAKTVR